MPSELIKESWQFLSVRLSLFRSKSFSLIHTRRESERETNARELHIFMPLCNGKNESRFIARSKGILLPQCVVAKLCVSSSLAVCVCVCVKTLFSCSLVIATVVLSLFVSPSDYDEFRTKKGRFGWLRFSTYTH